MTASRHKILLSLAIVALAQTAVLAYMVIDRVTLLRSGREITLPIVPVDPRDLFRGEYVRLSYAANAVPPRCWTARSPPRTRPSTSCWKSSRTAPGGPSSCRGPCRRRARPTASCSRHAPATPGRRRSTDSSIVMVRYGIESYFVPEGQGKKLEDLAREKKLATLVAVDARGNAAIKGLVIDGVLQYEEPLF